MVIIYVTYPDKKTAIQAGKLLLEHRLICCSNIFPITSQYVWEDKLMEDEECASYFKTTVELKDKAISMIEENHPYDIPMISHRHVSMNKAYESWADSFLGEQ